MPENLWQESSFCQAGNSCVGVRRDGDRIGMRESEQPDETISTTPETLKAFLLGIKNNEFVRLPS
ncbi:DUF397 domain-containing protein [Streptomyces sp. DT24]|uniref:DUF397 domain-containing protein n=1 Tax=unclassified Streptomyces TaxID=2593676 RepID=UPI0023BA38D0|nr:DUF397 domain-containing protein [Streptomyces sp. AM 4-1-1]WEH34236.1 DUF397 domain-containing protein [Streptomyces sp. AM 4-1-1]